MASALAFALAPVTEAYPSPQGGPTVAPAAGPTVPPAATHGGPAPASTATNQQLSSEGEQLPEQPVISIHSTGNVLRGKTGSFVLDMNPALMFGAMYVNFKVSGTAVAGVDYVALVSPAYIGQSGYGVISVATLPNPRGSFNRQAYSVVVTLEPGAGYAVGEPKSALIWIMPSQPPSL